MRKLTFLITLIFTLTTNPDFLLAQSEGTVDGELRKWHPVTITFEGPEVSETDAYNPFMGYRLNVKFRHESGQSAYEVPGYFAADGNAAETSATSGNKWRVHFTPDRTGQWTYTASFRRGEDIAVNLSSTAGESAAFDGATGTINISETDKSGSDLRGKGILRYVGEHYLRFDNGEWFMKGGADAPETLLAYADFDGTYTHASTSKNYGDVLLWGSTQHKDGRGATPLKKYEAHVQDWKDGDPEWKDGKGKGLIGALNYLSSKGMNAFSFLTLSAGGDGKNIWPWISHNEVDRYDVSKLAQWEKVFTHGDQLGMFLHFKTHENENDQLLNGGKLGPERKLYYRELIARFAHHPALNWNLGEEHDLWDELDDAEQLNAKADAQYIHNLDPYDHPVVTHTFPNQYQQSYTPLLGYEYFEGPSIQTNSMRPWHNFDVISYWVNASDRSERKWNVSLDEAGTGGLGVTTDDYDDNYNQDEARGTYWATIAAGGDGVEWYFGYSEEQNDLNMEDWRSRDALWDYTRHAMDFYKNNDIPFWEMENANNMTRSEKDFVYANNGELYVIYLPSGGGAALNLQNNTGTYTVDWYNPRTGGNLQKGKEMQVEQTYAREPASVLSALPNIKKPRVQGGNVTEVTGPGWINLGMPPGDVKEDWVILVRKK
ncbi:hypothetical protein OKW21_004111 [Catalinimonas alkaloidigena]|uniref:DUF5060 domain-containing protein n=1 Tax=Catalinimonas alkaloidigena TaxID=1075417 RepID=UPI0024055DB2|nr:DUF5060 domain-containing protein [Catalinimonas alkaloidigena]MDF9798848.1 hypothetical protein [Catalinimonas alkaloidigena]